MHYVRIKTSLLALALTLGSLTACDRDNGLEPQAHDDNAFMQINHTMLAQMDAMMMTGDADHDFAMMMQMHHQGAIDMSNELLKQGDDATIRALAQKVIDAQQKEKTTLSQFVQSHKAEHNATGQTAKTEYMMSMDKMEKAQDIRIPRSRLLEGEAYRGYSASKRRYFYGFRTVRRAVQVITTYDGVPIDFHVFAGSFVDVTDWQSMNIDLPEGSELYRNGGPCRQRLHRLPD